MEVLTTPFQVLVALSQVNPMHFKKYCLLSRKNLHLEIEQMCCVVSYWVVKWALTKEKYLLILHDIVLRKKLITLIVFFKTHNSKWLFIGNSLNSIFLTSFFSLL